MTALTRATTDLFDDIPISGKRRIDTADISLPRAFGQLSFEFTQDARIVTPKMPAVQRNVTLFLDTAAFKKDSSATSSGERLERSASQLLAEWRGQVTEVLEEAFLADLKGRHGEGVRGSEEEALIPLEDVRSDDRDLVRPGAFFSLCVCYGLSVDRQRRRFTDVVFRRLPAYRLEELEQARERARELIRGLRLE